MASHRTTNSLDRERAVGGRLDYLTENSSRVPLS